MTAMVSLVGAGPGDPELLTVRAVKRLQEADLVLYDALVDRAALQYAPHARWAYVGKRAGRHSIAQETIERVMIRRALGGERVVRLKSGDPFVFGRGGEEALALAAAGVPVEIVPGVSAAVAGPALSGIPVTHRGLASAFVVVSGHAESAYLPVLGSLAPQAATVVVLMGLATRARLAALLLSRGWARETPAAIVLAAATAESHTWRGTLAEIGTAPLPGEKGDTEARLCAATMSPTRAAALLVIGDVVRIAAQLEVLSQSREQRATGV
ncbi:MAG: uroporphyrinogen-III C-methyltransferase [Myxococcales bacterium]|nr:uroporphyrinogen-III C-methyltransferase [Myxococcales bacterium]